MTRLERKVQETMVDGGALLKAVTNDLANCPSISERMDRGRLVPDDVLAWMYERKLFKLLVPTDFGGMPVVFPHLLKLIEKIAWFDGSLGWLVQIGSGGGLFVPAFQRDVAQQLFGPDEAVIAGAGFPAGKAYRVEGGYRVTGKWLYASGAQYATLFTASAVCVGEGDDGDDDNGSPVVRAFAFRRDQVNVINDWFAFGMRATSSHTFTVEDAFVPEERVFVVGEHRWDARNPIYHFPFYLGATMMIGAVSVGLARRFFDEAESVPRWQQVDDRKALRTYIDNVHTDFFTIAEETWRKADDVASLAAWEKDAVSRVQQLIAAAVERVERVFGQLGMRVLWEDHPINRVYRDIQTAARHTALRP